MTDFTYSTGVVRALEEKILSDDLINRLSSLTRKEALKQLYDASYGAIVGEVDELIKNELSEVRNTLKHILPFNIFSVLILPYDSHNLKVILKDIACGTQNDELLYENTVYDTQIASACARGGEFSLLSDAVASHLNKAYDNGELSRPFSISCLCDRAFYARAYECAGDVETGDVIYEYFKTKVDCMNYMSVLRARQIKLSGDDLSLLLLPYGNAPCEAFEKMYDHPGDDTVHVFGLPCFDAIKAASVAETPSDAQQRIDEHILSLLEEHKYDTDTAIPSVIYFEKKNAEASSIRRVFSEIK